MADDVGRTREINFQGVNGDNNSRTLCNECNACKCTSTSAWMAILVTCAGTRARIKPRTLRYHVGVACRLPNKSLPVKNIPRPLGKRRDDGLLSRNRETFQLKVEPDATSSSLFFRFFSCYSTFSRNHFLCMNRKIETKINFQMTKRTSGTVKNWTTF